MFENIKPLEIEKVVLSNPIDDYKKAVLKKILINNNLVYQLELFSKTQVFHKNYSPIDVLGGLEENMKHFRQAEIWTKDYYYAFKITSKCKILSTKKKCQTDIIPTLHNKEKKHIIEEGMIVPPLVDLGVMSEDGRVVKAYYDKYKQINKFLEIIDNTIGYEEELNIIDFGCGKSYLTFILYYYLINIKKIKANIVGLDLKKDVIEECNKIKDKYGYSNLHFLCGDVATYKPENHIDMIITLHACDTATDYALYHAIRLKCKYILSVPCCQKEINKNLESSNLHLMNKYGLIKERFSSLLTDSIRANILEYYGYKVNIGEFIDFNHSPKNVLIKAIYTGNIKEESIDEVERILNEYKIKQTLYELCKKDKEA